MSTPVQSDWLSEASFGRVVTHPQRARKRDPETSKAAAEKSDRFVAKHEATIFAVIADAKDTGATAKEIAKACGLTDVQVNRRLGGMGERKVIVRKLRKDPVSETDFVRRQGCAVWFKA